MLYLDLDELPGLFRGRWLWSVSHPTLARFRRKDHLGPEDQPLDESVRDLIEAETGTRPAGPIRLLTNLAYFGYRFNPVSFYYCFARNGASVDFIVAEVNNTPWGEQDTYVLTCPALDDEQRSWRFSPKKKMHVSPFMPMNIEYAWALTPPDDRLSVYMAASLDGERCFHATLSMKRTEISSSSLASVLLRFPLMTLKIMAAIHWQALCLWLKSCPVYPHPAKTRPLAERRR